MPWEDIYTSLLTVVADEELRMLPHDENVLANLMRFRLEVGSVDISNEIADMHLRAHVVLRLGYELIDKGHPAFACRRYARSVVKEMYGRLVEIRYPLSAQDAARPELNR